MIPRRPVAIFLRTVLLTILLSTALLLVQVQAAAPQIDYVNKVPNTSFLAIHFEVPANRQYVLQYTDCANCLRNESAGWFDMYSPPVDTIQQHYVWADVISLSRPFRFYRLVDITP